MILIYPPIIVDIKINIFISKVSYMVKEEFSNRCKFTDIDFHWIISSIDSH